MATSFEAFVKQLEESGIVSSDKLKNFVPPKAHPKDADELVLDLTKQSVLTKFQAQHVLAGKTKALLLGNYSLLDKIGAGGMGQVFKAEHRRMERIVAIKMLPSAMTKNAGALARFQREVKAAAKLEHPNIVGAYDADEANGAHFLVMQYVEGSDLSVLVKKNGPFPVIEAVNFILQAARGLQFAHTEGVVHRDIKPSNLLLDRKGTLKILDMGLARISDPLADPIAAVGADLTHSGSILGTIDYMAPEQAMDSRHADARSDIYGLGCTLHYLLSGRPPYGGDTVLKRLTAHQQAAIPLLSSVRPDISPPVQEVFGRMVAKRPTARFQTSKELVAALETLVNQLASARPELIVANTIPATAVPATHLSTGVNDLESIMLLGINPYPRRVRRSTFRVPLVAAAAVLLLGAAAVGVWVMGGKQPDEIDQSEAALLTDAQWSLPEKPPVVTVERKPDVEPPKAPAGDSELEAMAHLVTPPVRVTSQSPPLTAKPAPTDIAAPRQPPPSVVPIASQPVQQLAAAPEQSTAASDGKLSIPSVETQRESLKLLKELYRDEYVQAKQPEAKAALAEKLLNDAQKTKNDAAALYLMLHEARDLAVDAANPALAERAIGMLAGHFAVEPLKDLAAALNEMAGKPHPADANRAIAEAALGHVEEPQVANDFDTAKQLADAALAVARKSRDVSLTKRAIEVGKTVVAAKQQWEAWQKSQVTLAQTPDDPAANLATGRYQCFVQGDWEQGLAHLAKGSDGPLKDLAAKGLKPPEDAVALAALGDAWFVAAEKAKGKDKVDLLTGAAYWYSQAEPGLTGLMKTFVEKRLKDLGGAVAVRVTRLEPPVANGLWLSQTFDCASQAYPVSLGQDFDIQRSWTLALEFRTPNLDPGARQLFYWRDERNSREPLFLRIYGTALEARLCDTHKDSDNFYSLGPKLSLDIVGAWQRVAVHYDASTREVSLVLNDTILARGRSHIVPSVDQPIKLMLGGVDDQKQRFTGQLRNVWLGNSNKPSLPALRKLGRGGD